MVRFHDHLGEESSSWEAKLYPFFNRGRRGTQETNFTGRAKQWENKEPLPAVLTTWAFIPELPQKQKNQTHTHRSSGNENILGLDLRHYRDSLLSAPDPQLTDTGKARQRQSRGTQQTPNTPHALGQGDANVGKWLQLTPAGKATLGGLQDKFQLTTPRDDRRDKLGDHIIPSPNTQQTDLDKLLGKARGQEESSELELIWIQDSRAAIEYKFS